MTTRKVENTGNTLKRELQQALGLFACLLAHFSFADTNELKVTLQSRGARTFAIDGVTFRNDYPTARMGAIERIDAGSYRMRIAPEAHPINDSAWYGFQVRSKEEQQITVALRYHLGKHRYHPLISTNGLDWESLPDDHVEVSEHRTEAVLTLDAGPQALWVSAREKIANEDVDRWLAGLPHVTRRVAGHSFAQRPLHHAIIGDPDGADIVFLLTRHHPPEVSGQLALQHFVEKLTDDSESSRRYRRRFTTHIFPLINPDGVHEGHWRRNFGNRDLNRTWTTAREPEIRALRETMLQLARRPNTRVWLLLDFHSTRYNVFFTLGDEHETFPPDFTRDWIAAIRKRVPEFATYRDPNHIPGHHTSKSWAYDTFGCPAITFEFEDHLERELLRKTARVSAEEMLRIFAATP